MLKELTREPTVPNHKDASVVMEISFLDSELEDKDWTDFHLQSDANVFYKVPMKRLQELDIGATYSVPRFPAQLLPSDGSQQTVWRNLPSCRVVRLRKC